MSKITLPKIGPLPVTNDYLYTLTEVQAEKILEALTESLDIYKCPNCGLESGDFTINQAIAILTGEQK